MPGNFFGIGVTIYGQDSAGGPAGPFNPASLFGGGETGFIYDATNLSTMFQERTGAAATTPSGANGPVGTWKDLSPNNNYAIAPSDAARCLSRQAAIPGTFVEPDIVDDAFVLGPAVGLFYVAACVVVPVGAVSLSTFANVAINTDNNDIRIETNSAWRGVGGVSNASDFSVAGGAFTVNGVATVAFANNTPHVFEAISPSAKNIGNLLGTATAARWGNMRTFRVFGISRVPSAGERASLRTWLGAAAGVVL